MYLRPFKAEDAATILSWIKDEHAFRLWSADRYRQFPATSADMLAQYDSDVMFPMTACKEDGQIVGHILLRYKNKDAKDVRLGFIIVDDTLRGQGYGKKMIQEAIEYAKKHLNAARISLGVFLENQAAVQCYTAAGFKTVGTESYNINGKEWPGAEMIYGM